MNSEVQAIKMCFLLGAQGKGLVQLAGGNNSDMYKNRLRMP